jgi:hypothetical protein
MECTSGAPPEVRDHLRAMARDWMRQAMDEEGRTKRQCAHVAQFNPLARLSITASAVAAQLVQHALA